MEPIDGQFAPQPGPQTVFMSSRADIAIYGGAAGGGKSAALLLEPLRNIDTLGFGALILRRTTPEIRGVGGLWDESGTIYPLLGGEPRAGCLDWKFKSGATVKFDHLEHETDKFKYQGQQIPLIEFDELTHFTESQFWYLTSRNRSMCGVRPYIRASCNPDADSFVASLIEWWIDPSTGFPLADRSGVVRWFVRVLGELQWGETREELESRYPGQLAKSLTFVAAKLSDNAALTARNPDYLANLQSLPLVDRQRLLDGNWKIRNNEQNEWGSECFDFDGFWYEDEPREVLCRVIATDWAATTRDTSDYTAHVLLTVEKGGVCYVDAVIRRTDIVTGVDTGIGLCGAFQPHAWAIEVNGFRGTAELIAQRAAGVMPPIATIHESTDKDARIKLGIGPYLSFRRLRFKKNSAGAKLLVTQLKNFPLDDYKDGPDALEKAIRVAREFQSGGVNHRQPSQRVVV